MTVWDGLVGQSRAVQLLSAAATAPSSSYLLVGPSGSGKTRAAKLFAAAIVCPTGGCGSCDVCSRVLRDLHPDVEVLEPEGLTFSVELIRDAVASSSQTPLEADRRVFVMLEADKIAERSQNALLKALEEPRSRTTFVLVATALDKFLPTILSRCQVIEFVQIPREEVHRIVSELAANKEVDDWVTAARGDVGKALALATQPEARDLRTLAVQAAVTVTSLSAAIDTASGVASIVEKTKERLALDHKAELVAFDESSGKGRGVSSQRKRLTDRHKRLLRRAENETYIDFVRWFASACRDLASLACGGGAVATDYEEQLTKAAAAARASEWLTLAERCLDVELAIIENANPLLAVEALLLRRALEGRYTVSAAGVAQW